MKKCSKCEEVKELGEFHNNKRMKDGKQRICKICVKAKDSKHWIDSGKKQPRRVAKKKLSKFKNNKLRELKDRVSDLEKKIKDNESFDNLVRCRERGFIYNEMNDYKMSFHPWNGTEDKLLKSRLNYNSGLRQYLEFDNIAKTIENGSNEYVCECCLESKKTNQYYTSFDIDAYRESTLQPWLIKDIFVNVFIYCFDCTAEGNTPRDKAINKLYEERNRMSIMLNNYYNAEEEDIRQRYKWSKSKSKHESKFLSNIDRSEDGKYLYIMEWNGIYKIGISNKPLTRLSSIKSALPGDNEVNLLYICKPYKGRCVDNEQLIHKSLKEYKESVTWKNGTKSREFFKCDLNLIKLAVSEQCYIEDVKELMT